MSHDDDEFEADLQPRSDGDRTTRERSRHTDSRSVQDRPRMDQWSPPSAIEIPPDTPDWHYRWVAEYVNAQHMPRNVQMRLREGYRRVNISELPEDFLVDDDVKGDGIARTQGLLLMKIPQQMYQQRQAYYRQQREGRLYAADALQGVAGRDAVQEDRGTRSLSGADAGRALQQMSR